MRQNIFYFYDYRISSEHFDEKDEKNNSRAFVVERKMKEANEYEPSEYEAIATFYVWKNCGVDFQSVGTKYLEVPKEDAARLNAFILRTMDYLIKVLNIQ